MTLRCQKFGYNYRRGQIPNYDLASCEEHETILALQSIDTQPGMTPLQKRMRREAVIEECANAARTRFETAIRALTSSAGDQK